MELEKIIESLKPVVDKEVFTEEFEKKFKDEIEIAINEQVQNLLVEKENVLKEEFEEKIDKYLTYVSEEFVKENEKNIVNDIKVEMSDKIIEGIKSVFEGYYIDIKPEDKDVITSLESKIADIKSDLNEQMNDNIEFKNQLLKSQIKLVFVEETKDLTDVQKEEIADLIEGIEVDSATDFKDKLNVIKEKFVNIKKKDDEPIDEGLKLGDKTKKGDSQVDGYLPDYLKKMNKVKSKMISE